MSVARYNIAPSQDVPAVRFDSEMEMRTLDMLRWGCQSWFGAVVLSLNSSAALMTM